MTYGIKVSKAGFDVKTCADKDLVMSSQFNMLKTKATGTIGTSASIAHGLSYVPIFLPMKQNDGAVLGTTVVGADSTYLVNLDASNSYKYYIFYQSAI